MQPDSALLNGVKIILMSCSDWCLYPAAAAASQKRSLIYCVFIILCTILFKCIVVPIFYLRYSYQCRNASETQRTTWKEYPLPHRRSLMDPFNKDPECTHTSLYNADRDTQAMDSTQQTMPTFFAEADRSDTLSHSLLHFLPRDRNSARALVW